MTIEKPVEKWSVKDFHNYLISEHERIFGIEYIPWRSWGVEQGLIGNIVGTTRGRSPKPGTHDKVLIKAFIDKCYASYKPTRSYPGINFGFMWSYMRQNLQKVEKERVNKEVAATYKKESEGIDSDWW